MKIVLAFDSFKGSLSASDACKAAEEGILAVTKDAEVVSVPLSDGGEGMVSCILRYGNVHPVKVKVHGPLMEALWAEYVISDDGKTAYMEMASACGLTLVPMEKRNPMNATTYGLGELIADAAERGVEHIVLGIGGSATCDAGMGMLEALNARARVNRHLSAPEIRHGAHRNYVEGYIENALKGIPFLTVACDVDNPLYGAEGAAYMFAPQKGATAEQVDVLDRRLRAFAKATEELGLALPEDALFPGAGAAGGLGYALRAYLGARLRSGIDVMLDACRFDEVLKGADLVITGEGCSDAQTTHGKVAAGVLKRVRICGAQMLLMSGQIKDEAELHAFGFERLYAINEGEGRPVSILMQPAVAAENIRKTCQRLMEECL